MACTPAQAQDWFARRGWQAFDFQRQVWDAMAAGRSGLLHANTGAGKTLAAWLGALARSQAQAQTQAGDSTAQAPPLQVLWLTPMRALATDTQRALSLPATELARQASKTILELNKDHRALCGIFWAHFSDFTLARYLVSDMKII